MTDDADAAADVNQHFVEEFRAHEGRTQAFGDRLLLLHHVGRSSGREYVTPVAFLPDTSEADTLYVFATAGGSPAAPQWCANILQAGRAEIEIGIERYCVRADEVIGEDRDRVWAAQVDAMPAFADYERAIAGARTIPVVALRRINEPEGDEAATKIPFAERQGATAQHVQPAPPEALTLSTQWLRAHLDRDAEFIRANAATPDDAAVHTIGSFPLEVTLAKFLDLLEASEPAGVQIESHPFGFVRNDVAWLTDLPRLRMPSGETRQARQTIVMVKSEGAWKVVHSHLSEGVAG